MIVDGIQIAKRIYTEIQGRVTLLERSPTFTIITCNPNAETKRYLALKEKKAAAVGITTNIVELPPESTTEDFLRCILEVEKGSDGIIVQLPLPQQVDRDVVVNAVSPDKDVDALNVATKGILSPVVGAIKEILKEHTVSPVEKFVTIIGSGKLVGLPAHRWFMEKGAYVSVVTQHTLDISHYTRNADIIVCGAGSPNLLTPSMIKAGVIILDAGTSEVGGELRGDADPACAEKALLFTPVPGGIGPITVAILLENVVTCAEAIQTKSQTKS